jgi:hypothetical protein
MERMRWQCSWCEVVCAEARRANRVQNETEWSSRRRLRHIVERSRYAAEEREWKEASHRGGRVVMFFGVDFPDSG